MIKKIVREIISFFPAYVFKGETYSQDGEDLFLLDFFSNIDNGFYVDVGAHHPFRFSNTYLLYKKGWSGINIDATPGSMKLFNKYRKRDINIEAGISNSAGFGKYFLFKEPALNGFENEITLNYLKKNTPLIAAVDIKFDSLKNILNENINTRKIDLMSIDVEGSELSVLESNDWEIYRPTILLVEMDWTQSLEQILDDSITKFLDAKGYKLYYRFERTCVFMEKDNKGIGK